MRFQPGPVEQMDYISEVELRQFQPTMIAFPMMGFLRRIRIMMSPAYITRVCVTDNEQRVILDLPGQLLNYRLVGQQVETTVPLEAPLFMGTVFSTACLQLFTTPGAPTRVIVIFGLMRAQPAFGEPPV